VGGRSGFSGAEDDTEARSSSYQQLGVVGGRTVARWRGERERTRRGGTTSATAEAVGIPMNHRRNGPTREDGGTSLVAAITVSGRHALLVGYQLDEALRPSLPASFSVTLSSLSLPLLLPYPFHRPSFSHPLSKSPRLRGVASRALCEGDGEFIDRTLYLYARLSALA
jgi:hypothetical protein